MKTFEIILTARSRILMEGTDDKDVRDCLKIRMADTIARAGCYEIRMADTMARAGCYEIEVNEITPVPEEMPKVIRAF